MNVPNIIRLGLGDSLTVVTNNNEKEDNFAIVYIACCSKSRLRSGVKF